MNRFIFKRDNSKTKATYVPVSGNAKALLVCPDCGLRFSLDKHTVQENGDVHASIVCPNADCKFHEWANLEGWVSA